MFISDLFEAQARQTLVIIPGGFHPFHPGHLSLYRSAEQAFPGATIVYVATDDQKDRPFPFAAKQKLAQIAGVNPKQFQLVRSPFVAKEVTQNFDPNNTVLIFARSEKDRNEHPKPGGVKKDGSPSYLQPYTKGNLAPMSQHGYMAYLPTVQFDAGPSGVTSATQIRELWPKANPAQKLEIVKDLYPKNPQAALQILDKYSGTVVAEAYERPLRPEMNNAVRFFKAFLAGTGSLKRGDVLMLQRIFTQYAPPAEPEIAAIMKPLIPLLLDNTSINPITLQALGNKITPQSVQKLSSFVDSVLTRPIATINQPQQGEPGEPGEPGEKGPTGDKGPPGYRPSPGGVSDVTPKTPTPTTTPAVPGMVPRLNEQGVTASEGPSWKKGWELCDKDPSSDPEFLFRKHGAGLNRGQFIQGFNANAKSRGIKQYGDTGGVDHGALRYKEFKRDNGVTEGAAPRVKEYEATVYHDSTGSSHTKMYPFTQVQADSVGGFVDQDGLDIASAQKLCDKWTRQGKHEGIRYSYRLPTNKTTIDYAIQKANAKRALPKGGYSDEAHPIRDDGNEGRPGKQRYPGMTETSTAQDPNVIQMKKRARVAHPFAASDEEALALYVSDREIKDVDALEREQNRELKMIDRIEQGENKLEKEIAHIDAILSQLSGKVK